MDATEIKTALEATTTQFKELLDKKSQEIKQFGETSAETAKQIKSVEATLESLASDIKSIDEKHQERIDELEAKSNRLLNGGGEAKKTMGDQFIESEAYAEIKARGFRGESSSVEIKDITGLPASAGALLTPYLRDAILREPDRTLFVRQLLNNVPVNTDAVQIFRELAFDNQAGFQPAPSGNPVQLGEKPKSDITFESDTVTIETIAHYIIASRQILSDVPRLRAYIDQRLVYGLNLKMDEQILYGDGNGQNFTGLLVDPAVQDVGAMAAGVTIIDHVRDAVTMAQQANYYNVNGLVIRPQDWAEIEKAKGDDGHYIWVNVQDGGTPRLWRVPVVVSNAMEEGDFILGDWTMGASLYTREGISVRTSESHADLFVRNGVAILAEERAALGVELPLAFVKGTFGEEVGN